MVSLRLSKQLEQWISSAARVAGVSKSEFIRQCLEDSKQSAELCPNAYELGKEAKRSEIAEAQGRLDDLLREPLIDYYAEESQ